MQKERLPKFDFDFNKVYKKIKATTNKIGTNRNSSLSNTKYYYLGREDFIQDVFALTFKYLKDNEQITEDHFISLFWTNWKIMRLNSFDKRNPRVHEYKNFVQMSTIVEDDDKPNGDVKLLGRSAQVSQDDLDRTLLLRKVGQDFPTISKVISGYSFAEAGREEGITRRGYSKRFHKEVDKLKQISYV